MKRYGQWLIPAAAAAALIEALVLAAIDRVPAATLVAGVFVVVVLFYYFPQLEYFKAFTVEAKLREKLNEADILISRMRSISVILAKESFISSAYMNRMTTQKIDDLIEKASELRTHLRESGVAESEIVDAGLPFVAATMFDLYHHFSQLSYSEARAFASRIRMRMAGNMFTDESKVSQEEIDVRRRELATVAYELENPSFPTDVFVTLMSSPQLSTLEGFMSTIISARLEDEKALSLRQLRGRIIVEAARCFKAGTVTKEAASLIEELKDLNESVVSAI